MSHLGVGDDVVGRVAHVYLGLEDLHLEARDPGASESADEFLALTGKHRAGDDFDPPGVRVEAREVFVAALCGESVHL